MTPFKQKVTGRIEIPFEIRTKIEVKEDIGALIADVSSDVIQFGDMKVVFDD